MSQLALREADHAKGCENGRVEFYEATQPNGNLVTIGRCIDCGAQEVHQGARDSILTPKSEKDPKQQEKKSNG